MKAAGKKPSAYAAAGVDIDEMMTGLGAVKRLVNGTATAGVLSRLGSFGGLFRSPGRDTVLVASTDGVGTKLNVAVRAGRHDSVGQCLVNHCVNDILVQGAEPLFFLDYLGTARLSAATFRDVIKGLCKACRANGCALLGGETAEMPGLYPEGEYDLVGTIVGAVPRKSLVTGASIRPGDVLIGLPSSGLHTNGYSLARRILFEQAGLDLEDRYPGTRSTVADVLLAVHRSYLKPVRALRAAVRVHGMAHITGGGLTDNVPRVLPAGTQAVIDRHAWTVPVTFRYLMERGEVDRDEMYRVFNMGIGYVVIVRPRDEAAALKTLRAARCAGTVIGRIERGPCGVVYAS
jgi:phosphoribosylformylglycinamidine cyclo-ligase